MTIKKLLKKLARPVDTIIIRSEGENASNVSDGFDLDTIPEELFGMKVKTWEVQVDLEMMSICEATINYILYIIV